MEQKIIDYLKEELSPYLLILFGSISKGTPHKDSDVDVAFLSDCTFSEYEIFIFSQQLATILNKEVDLIDLKRTNTVFKAQIIGTGKVLLDLDPLRRMAFFTQAYKEYAKLNEERKPIFDYLKKTGSLYD